MKGAAQGLEQDLAKQEAEDARKAKAAAGGAGTKNA